MLAHRCTSSRNQILGVPTKRIVREHFSKLVVYNDIAVLPCCPYVMLLQPDLTFFPPSKVSHPPVVTPITLPPQRVVLRPSDLSSRRVDLALELGLRTPPNIRVQFRSIAVGSDSRALFQLRQHIARRVRSRGFRDIALGVRDRVMGRRRWVGGRGARARSAEGSCGLFLQLFEDLLLFLWEAWWAWLWCPGGLRGAGGGEWAAEEAWAHGADGPGDRVHGDAVLEECVNDAVQVGTRYGVGNVME